MHTTPLLSERDTDLRRAIHAVDPEGVTTVLPAVVEPARDPKHGFVLAAVGAVVGLGALALLVALVLATSNNSTRPAVVSPPLAPVTTTTTAQAVTTTPSAAPSAGGHPVARRHSAADRCRLGGENGAVRACAGPGSCAPPVARTVPAPVPLIYIDRRRCARIQPPESSGAANVAGIPTANVAYDTLNIQGCNSMNVRGGFAVIAAMASMGLAIAGPAHAAEPMNGV